MTFEYVYRNNDGAMVHGIIEADSRSKAFAAVKSKGIAPVSMHECPNGNPSVSARTHGGYRLPILLSLAGVIVAITCWLILRDNHGEVASNVPNGKRNSLIKEANNSRRAKGSDAAQKLPEESSNDKIGFQPGASSATQANTESSGTQDAKQLDAVKPVFDNASDQLLAMATSGRPGVPMPPLPIAGPGTEMMFRASLEKPIEILDSDTDAVKELKQRVLETREEVKQLMERGLTFQQIMQEHQSLANDNASIRTKAMIEAREIFESGDTEGAETYIKTMNKAFEEMGIQPIKMPGKKYGRYSQGKKQAVESAKALKE